MQVQDLQNNNDNFSSPTYFVDEKHPSQIVDGEYVKVNGKNVNKNIVLIPMTKVFSDAPSLKSTDVYEIWDTIGHVNKSLNFQVSGFSKTLKDMGIFVKGAYREYRFHIQYNYLEYRNDLDKTSVHDKKPVYLNQLTNQPAVIFHYILKLIENSENYSTVDNNPFPLMNLKYQSPLYATGDTNNWYYKFLDITDIDNPVIRFLRFGFNPNPKYIGKTGFYTFNKLVQNSMKAQKVQSHYDNIWEYDKEVMILSDIKLISRNDSSVTVEINGEEREIDYIDDMSWETANKFGVHRFDERDEVKEQDENGNDITFKQASEQNQLRIVNNMSINENGERKFHFSDWYQLLSTAKNDYGDTYEFKYFELPNDAQQIFVNWDNYLDSIRN